jgi:L-lysine exporter family protein LysE/ArgO
MFNSLTALFKGFTLFAGLIVAVGSQNAFVLRQGLKRQYVFHVAGICFLCDVTLIVIGATGFGTLSSRVPKIVTAVVWAGAIFVFFYGLYSFKSAFAPVVINVDKAFVEIKSLRKIVLTALALSLLNPHVYIDTIIIIGGLATQYPINLRIFFVLGSILASLIWFFGLGYGAVFLTPLFQRPSVWRVLDIIIGCLMWSIAASLIFSPPHT